MPIGRGRHDCKDVDRSADRKGGEIPIGDPIARPRDTYRDAYRKGEGCRP